MKHAFTASLVVVLSLGALVSGCGSKSKRNGVFTPAAASGLVTNVLGSTQVDLFWADNSTDESGFKVQRRTLPGGAFVDIKTTAANAVSYPDTTVAASTSYEYRIVATSSAGDAAPSNAATANTPVPANGRLYVSNPSAALLTRSSIASFANANAAGGDTAPTTNITGTNTGLASSFVFAVPLHLAIDVPRDHLYVANGSNVLVFHSASTATGNVAPNRTLTTSAETIFVDATNDRLYVGHSTGLVLPVHQVDVFENASTRTGAVTPDRSITDISLGSMLSLFVDVGNDRLFVLGSNGVGVYDSASTTAGTDAATRDRTLALTGTVTAGVWVDGGDRLYVSSGAQVAIYDGASTVAGNAPPARVLTDSVTGVSSARGIFVHPATNELFVVDAGLSAVAIYADASTINGNVTATRTLAGAATTLGSSVGIAVDPTRD